VSFAAVTSRTSAWHVWLISSTVAARERQEARSTRNTAMQASRCTRSAACPTPAAPRWRSNAALCRGAAARKYACTPLIAQLNTCVLPVGHVATSSSVRAACMCCTESHQLQATNKDNNSIRGLRSTALSRGRSCSCGCSQARSMKEQHRPASRTSGDAVPQAKVTLIASPSASTGV
jgi:hypothetical protein